MAMKRTMMLGIGCLFMAVMFIQACGDSKAPTLPSASTPTPAPTVCSNIGYASPTGQSLKSNTFIQALAVTILSATTVHSLSVSIGTVGSGHPHLGIYTDVAGSPVSLVPTAVVTD